MTATRAKTKRIKTKEAAGMLGVTTLTLNSMIARGLFTVKQDVAGGDRYLLSDEIDLWIEEVGTPQEMEQKLRDFRIRRKRLKAN